MSEQKNLAPLILGLILIAFGGLFLAGNLLDLTLPGFSWWGAIARLVIPGLLAVVGTLKLVRHFTWDRQQLMDRPRRSSLLSGLFWLFLGTSLFLAILTDLDGFDFFATYWPIILVAFGLGKIIDFYRLEGRLQFRAGEVAGVIFIIFLGALCGRLSGAPIRFVNFDIPWIIGDVSLGEFTGRRYRWESQEEVALEGARLVEISNQYGDVRVDSHPEDDVYVQLSKVVFHKSYDTAQEIAEQIETVTDRGEDVIRLGINRRELDQDYQFNTHLVVRVPENVAVRVSNRYGTIRATRLSGTCELENSDGEVVAQNISGDLTIRNKYRPVTAGHVEGKLKVENRRGQVRISDVSGDVEASTSYERISARDIEGSLVATNHYGSVTVEKVSGAVTVAGLGSEVSVVDAGQGVVIENSHKAVEVRRTGGPVTVETSYSRATLTEVQGLLTIRASNSEITAGELQGGAGIQARSSSIELSEVSGALDLATSLRRLRVTDFTGPAELKNEYGEIALSPRGLLAGPLRASNSNGEITVRLLEESHFKLVAQANGGRVVSDFGHRDDQEDMQFLEFLNGNGEPEVRLQTTYSDIRIRKGR